ncbi:MAG: endonuclease/exonuclease/phosphatase family protein [Waddliaceae bacterium]
MVFYSTSASFASYNILNPFHAVKWKENAGLNEDGRLLSRDALRASTAAQNEYAWNLYSNWDQRCPKISENIQFADVVCLQEVSRETIETLQNLTKGYKLAVVVYHSSRRVIQEFGNAILYQAEKASLKKSFEIRHVTDGSSRAAACGIFEICGKVIEVVSLHLAGYNSQEADRGKKQESKERGFTELQTYVKGLESNVVKGTDGIIIGGDLNEDQSEAEFDLYRVGYLESFGYQFDGSFAATEPSKNRRIDWLGYKPLTSREVFKLAPMGVERIQKQASDHLMTGTVVEWTA